jgi:hypothetical protein
MAEYNSLVLKFNVSTCILKAWLLSICWYLIHPIRRVINEINNCLGGLIMGVINPDC